ncbi:dTDP-4-dehydrorhamnose reductase [Chengkuizengella axinellae]|uniref:dTDP-4-dehydrorhamnose reductase n=1 Tax=Chengkuizengella axinellae TaxID=3064388 RepID=A0ABT9J1R0_9BACL|nr:dTDP-4-dehydrorhamnose reductase [Chengkuizengella sp. 2205SS18-9]MDP5275508.1 dTDP-4-dehydrorhamnose reductase [Chengkuizengella sp. 2205SS18-9]
MKRLKVLITGANGQLGTDMVNHFKATGNKVYDFGKHELDITDVSCVQKILHENEPDVVIHCAAYTNVNLAETKPDQAYLINSYGSRNIAIAAEQISAKLVYISTDYVFDGNSSTPYTEFDQTNPINHYGKSKLAGEQFVRDFHNQFYIVRTSWLYGKHGRNFVKNMLTLAKEKNTISVVFDQIGSPTYTVDLCERIHQLIQTDKFGIYHISNTGSCSWFDFANCIFKEKNITIQLNKVRSEYFKYNVLRPTYSVLSDRALILNDFKQMRHWKDALKESLTEIN